MPQFLSIQLVGCAFRFRTSCSRFDFRATADVMLIDTAVMAFYNFLRVQGWIGNLSLTFEREAVGQAL